MIEHRSCQGYWPTSDNQCLRWWRSSKDSL